MNPLSCIAQRRSLCTDACRGMFSSLTTKHITYLQPRATNVWCRRELMCVQAHSGSDARGAGSADHRDHDANESIPDNDDVLMSGSSSSRWSESHTRAAYAAAALAVWQLSVSPSHARDVSTSAFKEPLTSATESGGKSSGSSASPAQGPDLTLFMGGFIIPHPSKVAKGGEDAYYIAKTGRSFGVADGVGGWADVGVDPGEFSRALMREARKAAEGGDVEIAPRTILEEAYDNAKGIMGSSTACIACLHGRTLKASNLGDSGFMVVRDGKLVFESPPQQHSFNFPYQIGSYGDAVSASEAFAVDVQPGDVIIAGSDGLLDNVFNQRSAKLVWEAKKRGATPGVSAQQLAQFAAARARDPVYLSPFAKAAREAGFYYQGGKLDDITVLVAYVAEIPSSGRDQDAAASAELSKAPSKL